MCVRRETPGSSGTAAASAARVPARAAALRSSASRPEPGQAAPAVGDGRLPAQCAGDHHGEAQADAHARPRPRYARCHPRSVPRRDRRDNARRWRSSHGSPACWPARWRPRRQMPRVASTACRRLRSGVRPAFRTPPASRSSASRPAASRDPPGGQLATRPWRNPSSGSGAGSGASARPPRRASPVAAASDSQASVSDAPPAAPAFRSHGVRCIRRGRHAHRVRQEGIIAARVTERMGMRLIEGSMASLSARRGKGACGVRRCTVRRGTVCAAVRHKSRAHRVRLCACSPPLTPRDAMTTDSAPRLPPPICAAWVPGMPPRS